MVFNSFVHLSYLFLLKTVCSSDGRLEDMKDNILSRKLEEGETCEELQNLGWSRMVAKAFFIRAKKASGGL